MSVEVTHKAFGNRAAAEYTAAESLKKKIEDYFLPMNVSGKIQIFSGITLPGGLPCKDIDIFVAGFLDNYHQVINCETFSVVDRRCCPEAEHDVYVQSFFFPIELKDHPASRVRMEGFDIQVQYNGTWGHSVVNQNNKQQTSLMTLFQSELGGTPFVRNLIWFRQLSQEEALKKFGNRNLNILIGDFEIKEMFSVLLRSDVRRLVQKTPTGTYVSNDIDYALRRTVTPVSVEAVMNLFTAINTHCGDLTRQKLELLTQKIAEGDMPEMGKEFTICQGRAGTGKTVRLLQYAKKKSDEGCRCLLITYNLALVGDIKRLLAICGVPDKIDEGTVQITTLHSFFLQMAKEYGVSDQVRIDDDFDTEYPIRLASLRSRVAACELKKRMGWDYIFVDEAQDWSDDEKNILFEIYGPEHIVVADGVDQFMRSSTKQNWGKNINNFTVKKYNVGLRQKYILSSFVNTFAIMAEVPWDVKINDDFRGGDIIITDSYNPKLHKELADRIEEDGNAMYDLLMLVPSSLTRKDENGKTHFANLNAMRKRGIMLFDGTNEDNRHRYPTNINEGRLFQYESCRGLEGWCVVCMNFDEMVNEKIDYYASLPSTNDGEMVDPVIVNRAKAYLWSLMPLTRAIDTLVIVIKDLSGPVWKILKKTDDAMGGVFDWRISEA